MKRVFVIENFFIKDVTVCPQLALYEVKDFMGRPMHILAILLNTAEDEPFAMLTKSFGEFLGMKNCAYIDTNNCPFAKVLLEKGVAKDTGLTKRSGFCTYPLWVFEEDFLKEIGGSVYECYSKEYDSYMGIGDEEEEY